MDIFWHIMGIHRIYIEVQNIFLFNNYVFNIQHAFTLIAIDILKCW